MDLRKAFKRYRSVVESFVHKTRSKKNTDLVPDLNYPDGVYILHEVLGVKTVEGWNTEFNEGVVGVLLVEGEHQIVIALEDSPKKLYWSKDCKLINRPVDGWEDAVSDFNGERYCRNLNSPEFPAAYYCLNYKKGGRDWYLPSAGELWLICRHLEEIQNTLSIVGGQEFVTTWKDGAWYWSSTEDSVEFYTWVLLLDDRDFSSGGNKVDIELNVRPVSNFRKKNTLKESFTKKISSKKNTDLISKPSFVLDNGVYILHETLGVRGVEGWKPKFNNGVIGILVVEDEHQIVVALEEKEYLTWSKKPRKVNQSIEDIEDAKSDFNGEKYCRNLNSPDFPAAYYCLNYKKGGRDWYLPSSGELLLVRRHLEEIQSALSVVGGQKFVTDWKGVGMPLYWSSTEYRAFSVWNLNLYGGYIEYREKVSHIGNVRPIFKFQPSELKESFTKKIKSVRKSDLTSKPSFVLDDGVYILHETLGIQSVEGWNKKFNEGVIGILVVNVEDDHKFVVALEDSPKKLHWSKKRKLVNRPVDGWEDAVSDFNGEKYCKSLNSPEFPAAYYCLNYNKGGRNWHLPSAGELLMIYWYIEEIEAALSIVGGQKFDTEWKDVFWDRTSWYWSSTEQSDYFAWAVNLYNGTIDYWPEKVREIQEVRPISKFQPSELKESFTKKISSKKNTDLISKPAFVADGVYILHETLGVKTVDSWNPKDNDGVIGILLIEDDHKIIISLEDSPENLFWSQKIKLINRPVDKLEDAESDFNGEEYCKNLDSPEFPAAYYCLNYKKGGLDWYLPSTGELSLIYRHLEEIQTALSIVGGQKFVDTWHDSLNGGRKPLYWSSTESGVCNVWRMNLKNGGLYQKIYKSSDIENVRPISKFQSSKLKESFTKKISSKKNTDLIPDMVYPDGVYIFHKTLGVKTVEEWNKKFNEGVVGILVVEDDHKFVVALEDSPNHLIWSKEWKLINRPIEEIEDAEYDFNGEEYCKNLNSPDFPAAYYCLNYNKGNRSWYLPSTGELKSIYRYLEEIQNALSIVGGQKFISDWNCVGMPWYWSSTESGNVHAWFFDLADGILRGREPKVSGYPKVRPISKFQSFELKESFTKKIVSRIEESFVDKIKKSSEKSLIGKSEEVFDIYLDLKKFVFENSFTFTDGWYYFDIKDFDSIPVCHEFLDDLEINDYNEYLYTYGNILLKKGKSWKDSKLMVEINKSDSSELYDDVVKTVPWDYLSDYQGEQKRIVDCLLET